MNHKSFTTIFLTLITLCWSVALQAQDVTIDGISYSCDSGGTASITGADVSGDIVIPEKITYNGAEYTVAVIWSEAFKSNGKVTSVSMPTVTTIGYCAFGGCTRLASVDMPAVTNIGQSVFSGCTSLASVDMPVVTKIDDGAFSGCTSLTSVDMPTVTSIGNEAFHGCTNLTSADMPAVTGVGGSAFYGCTSLTSADMPAVTGVGRSAFYGCTSLTSVDMPAVTNIVDYAFHGCTNLASVDMTAATNIGMGAFNGCTSLESVNMPAAINIGMGAFSGCTSLESVNMPAVTNIVDYAFSGCSSLASVDMPAVANIGSNAFINCTSLTSADMPAVTSIGYYAFCNCISLASLDIPAVTSIGEGAFSNTWENSLHSVITINIETTTPPTLGSDAFSSLSIIKVPESAVDTYKTADGWSTYKSQILSLDDITDYDVTATAQEKESGLQNTVGKDNLNKVVTLKVMGTINSYDIMMIRNKMPNLHHLDLTNANIVANDYEYYTGYHTEDNVIGDYMFYELAKLASLKLPDNATAIDDYAISRCSFLRDVTLPSKLEKIGSYTFSECTGLTGINFPTTLKTIGSGAFSGCRRLESISLPTVENIDGDAFRDCTSLKSVSLPSVETIGDYAFQYCSSLADLKISSATKSIGSAAFSYGGLQRIYTYTVEPIDIDQSTFSNYTTATLYVPMQAKDNYYWNTEWSQFTNVEEFDEPYTYFYLNKEFTLNERFNGEPSIDINPGGGIIIPEDQSKDDQDADEVHIKGDGSNWASIVANANLNAKVLYVDITINANKWYFLSFPFKVKRTDISCNNSAKFIFRTYDGAVRAEHGSGGWVKLEDSDEYLQPFKGYIFQASASCTLSVKIEKDEFGKLPNVDVDTKLELHASDNEQNASWNFVGNPFTAWYDIDDMGYGSPITRWNSSSNTYEALRPGDDEAFLHPFEAFFVQRPNDSDDINFKGDNRKTQTGKDKALNEKQKKARAVGRFDVSRQIINLTLSDGTTTDKTRVVFNPEKQNAYEKDCDAAKFEGSANVELYTVEALAGRLAINERPEGSVQLGYRAAKAGEYTIAALRMDSPVLLYDNVMKITFDLTQGDYSFSSEAGRYDNRFMLVADKNATGIADIVASTGVNVKPTDCGINVSNLQGKTLRVYDMGGTLSATCSTDGFITLQNGIYVVDVDGLRAKFMVK